MTYPTAQLPTADSTTTARVATLRAELRDDTSFVATPAPRLTWTVEAGEAAWMQASAALTDGTEREPIDGRESALVVWPCAPLTAGEAREQRVRVPIDPGSEPDWSEPLR